MSAKLIFFIIITQLCSNGWWFCATQQNSINETPVVLIPIITSLVLVVVLVLWIWDNWTSNESI